MPWPRLEGAVARHDRVGRMSSLGAPPGRAARVGRLTRRSGLLVLAVLALIAGVVAMHSLGLGHGPMSMASAGHGVGSSETHHAAPLAAGPAPAHRSETAQTCATCLVVVAAGSSAPAHGMGSMCLAVLPILLLLLVALLRRRTSTLTHPVRRGRLRVLLRSGRDPPAYLRPSLSKLCILRI